MQLLHETRETIFNIMEHMKTYISPPFILNSPSPSYHISFNANMVQKMHILSSNVLLHYIGLLLFLTIHIFQVIYIAVNRSPNFLFLYSQFNTSFTAILTRLVILSRHISFYLNVITLRNLYKEY